MATPLTISDRCREIGQSLRRRLLEIPIDLDDSALLLAVTQAIDDGLLHLDATGIQGPDVQQPSAEFWRAASDVLSRGTLQWHAREKPRGFPGDHAILDRICRNHATSKSPNDRLGLAMDKYFQDQAAPQAVRNRYKIIADYIRQTLVDDFHSPISTLSLGSGPAWEIRWALDATPCDRHSRLTVHLLDIDPAALAFCEKHLITSEAKFNPTVMATRVNLRRFPRLIATHEELGKSQLVYCAGLFDYLNDDQFVEMLQTLWGLVAENGRMLIFNFAKGNPSQPYMEWIGNWYLIHRTPQSLESLAFRAALPGCHFSVKTEDSSVNLFLDCQRT